MSLSNTELNIFSILHEHCIPEEMSCKFLICIAHEISNIIKDRNNPKSLQFLAPGAKVKIIRDSPTLKPHSPQPPFP